MVKNLDNGDIISAEKLYEDYRMKGGVVNPLAYQIYKRSAQAGADENLTDSRMSLAEDDPIKKREGFVHCIDRCWWDAILIFVW